MWRSWSSHRRTVPRSAATLVIGNGGSGLLPWRVAEAPSWLDFDVSAGVAVGGGDWFGRGGAEQPSVLRVRASAGGVPEGEHIGELRLEASLARWFNDRADCYRLSEQARRSVLPRRRPAELSPRPCSSTDRAADF